MADTVKIRFTKRFVESEQNAPFLDSIVLGRTYKAHPTERAMCTYDYRVEVDGTFVLNGQTDGFPGCWVYRGIVPAFATEVEVVS